MKIEWVPEKVKQGRKLIDAFKAVGEKIAEGRFILYPVNKMMNMWCLYDVNTQTQHYIFREAAEAKIKGILNKEKTKG